jgi:RimJ/RimL family protein N-acetyltransferase
MAVWSQQRQSKDDAHGRHHAAAGALGHRNGNMTITAESERLYLRPTAAGDWPVFRDYALSERAQLSMGVDTETAAWQGFAHLIGHRNIRGFAPFAISLRSGNGRAIGMAGPYFPAGWPEPELGWQLWDGQFEGKGYASEAVVMARSWCAGAFGWKNMVSYINEGNVPSIRLAERLGCRRDETAQRRADGSPVWRHPE